MQWSSPLPAQLTVLTAALDEPGTDLEAVLSVLVDDLTAAVPSFLGLALTVVVDGHRVTLAAADANPPGGARASLLLPLDLLTGADPDITLVFYAGHPGAFVDLAADLRFAYGLDGEIRIDAHLPALTPPPSGVAGLAEQTLINRAIGYLIIEGFDPADAATELRRRADATGRSVADTARDLLAEPRPPTG
jgi:hypothetical protein